jgi:uncharacterized membrane protein HdeD (DUF308 family)
VPPRAAGLPFILGSLELATGVLVLMYQGLTALVLLYIVAFRMVFAGMLAVQARERER